MGLHGEEFKEQRIEERERIEKVVSEEEEKRKRRGRMMRARNLPAKRLILPFPYLFFDFP